MVSSWQWRMSFCCCKKVRLLEGISTLSSRLGDVVSMGSFVGAIVVPTAPSEHPPRATISSMMDECTRNTVSYSLVSSAPKKLTTETRI